MATVAILADFRRSCDTLAKAAGLSLIEDAYMFAANIDGSEPLKPRTVTQRYRRLVTKLGISTSIKMLRHYSATELLTGGVGAADPISLRRVRLMKPGPAISVAAHRSSKGSHADGSRDLLRVLLQHPGERQRAIGLVVSALRATHKRIDLLTRHRGERVAEALFKDCFQVGHNYRGRRPPRADIRPGGESDDLLALLTVTLSDVL